MKKRIIYLLLSAILVLSPMNLVYGAESDENSQLELLQGLDIVCGLDESKLETPIPKSTFINYVLNIAGEYKYADFYDENSLSMAEQMGIISSAKSVSKNASLSSNEAVTIAVRFLGHELLARDRGGYPEGYRRAASSLGILKGVVIPGDKVTYGQAIRLLYNMIDVDYSNYGLGYNLVAYNDNITALEHFRKIYTVKAEVTADCESDLFGSGNLGKGFVKIGDVVYLEGESNIRPLLGHYVKAYIKKTEDDAADTVVYAEDKAREIFTLNAEDIETVENNLCTIKYYKNKTSMTLSKLKIAKDAAYALNSVSYPGCRESDFKKDGTIITLVDNDGDSQYDFVNLESYDTMVVSSVSVSSMKIHNEFTFDANLSTLDLEDYEEEKIHVIKNDVACELFEIEKGDILSVYRTPKGSDGEVRIYAHTNNFEGMVEGYSIDDEEAYAIIDGTKYELSKLYVDANRHNEQLARTLNPSMTYMFGCDKSGKIVLVKAIYDDSLKYGYVVKKITSDDGEEVRFTMFMEDGSWAKYLLADRIRWNGQGKIKLAQLMQDSEFGASIPGLIGIKLDQDGKVKAIETPVAYSANMDKDRLSTTGEVTANYRYNDTTFSNYYYMDSDTKVFIIPEDGSKDRTLYQIGSNTSFKSDQSYTFEGYNRDEYYNLDMVVSKRTASTIQTVGDTLYMVKDVGIRYDDYHGVVPCIKVASSTYAGVSLFGEENMFGDLSKGDLIKIHTNTEGLIDNYSIIYSMASGVEKVLPTVNERHSASSMVKGIVKNIDVDQGRLLVETAEEMAFKIPESTPVLIYDAKENTVTVGNIKDVDRRDFVNVSLSRSQVNLLAIYKGLQ